MIYWNAPYYLYHKPVNDKSHVSSCTRWKTGSDENLFLCQCVTERWYVVGGTQIEYYPKENTDRERGKNPFPNGQNHQCTAKTLKQKITTFCWGLGNLKVQITYDQYPHETSEGRIPIHVGLHRIKRGRANQNRIENEITKTELRTN